MNTAIEAIESNMDNQSEISQRRKGAVRTAWLLTAVATLIFVLFVLSGVMGN